MSKIGKKPIMIPAGVDVKVDGSVVIVKGPKGELKRSLSDAISLNIADGKLEVTPRDASQKKQHSSIWGLERALVQNMIKGVSIGFEELLEFQGVGYKAVPKGKDLELSLGFSHTILFPTPEGIEFKIEKNVIRIQGIDKELVGHVAAKIRSYKEPEPYRASGVKYSGEVIKIKAGKKAATAGA